MPHQLRYITDPFEFARAREHISGELDLDVLPRLTDVVRPGSGLVVRYQVSGAERSGKPFLDLVISAELIMTCQRCLQPLECRTESEGSLLLVRTDKDLPDDALEEDDFDPVHAGRDFDVFAAVEEELLLALPLAPMHDDCEMPVAEESGGEQSPFAALKSLKIQGGGEK
jgi:uncharacterized protein